ncbi:hypothetical protein RFI_01566 [Reticulomyxa filosa]|uniref:Uncharacterized protein n=1 Tax=Reticulomyxa filosa TaxID=46433 RepID=X6PBE5_RETFI|nr:hypothetical protein RFI_01566 [Reticulomyxa filosa]|eukprot:ETO35496.1 hypothetical protein RFI_01566 [Reticulomyxa filosa]
MYLLNSLAGVSCVASATNSNSCSTQFRSYVPWATNGEEATGYWHTLQSLHANFWLAAHALIIASSVVLTITSHLACLVWPKHVQKGGIFFIIFWDSFMLSNICFRLEYKLLSFLFFVMGTLHVHIAMDFMIEALPIFWFFPDDEIAIIDPQNLTIRDWIVVRYKMFFLPHFQKAQVQYEIDSPDVSRNGGRSSLHNTKTKVVFRV